MISRHKFIKGKLVYQKSPYSEEYFARPYTFREGSLEIPVSSSSEEVSKSFAFFSVKPVLHGLRTSRNSGH